MSESNPAPGSDQQHPAATASALEDDETILPEHLQPVDDPNHDGLCSECRRCITIGPDGTEYGHARAVNRRGDRDDCSYRPNRRVDPPGHPNQSWWGDA